LDEAMLRVITALLTTALLLTSAPALANEFCDKELGPMVQQRKALNDKLAAIGKRAKQPGAREQFCGTLTAYIGNVRKFLTYMEQNKDFCAIPDQAIAQAKQGLVQNQTLRKKVCLASAQPQPGAPGKPAIPRPPVTLRLQ
jgi:hypothetical protein